MFSFQGLVELQYFGGWQNRIPVEKSTGRLILRSDHALVTIPKTKVPSKYVKIHIVFLKKLFLHFSKKHVCYTFQISSLSRIWDIQTRCEVLPTTQYKRERRQHEADSIIGPNGLYQY